jgi:hypothetical protein
MSDYLWDKSGEPDAEVERLEELLGGLSYQPRELQLPLTTQLTARLNVATRRNYRPGLAAAAALVLMGLAGFWLVQHRGRATVSPSSAVAQATQAAHQTQPTREANAVDNSVASNSGVSVPVKVDEGQAKQRFEVARLKTAQALPQTALRRRQELVGPHIVGPNANGASNEGREVADTGAQRRRLEQQREAQLEQQAAGLRAKEELMLALQVASTKLNHAQRKARGGTAIPGPDSKPAAPASIPWNKSR